MLEKEFIPYDQALALKELGFDEPCIGYYYNGKICFDSPGVSLPGPSGEQPLPLYQQAFRWFREKHNLDSCIQPVHKYDTRQGYYFYLRKEYRCFSQKTIQEYTPGITWKTYEEAELACLDKIIEIVKSEKN